MLTATAVAHDESFFDDLRAREFSRLDAQGMAYLDYTGSALYGQSQVRAHHAWLQCGIFGNPHSAHGPSRASADVIDSARLMILRFFDVDPTTHVVCLTANATAAIKLVAESYPFTRDAACVLSADNHNSVNGIREYARRASARVAYLPLDAQLHLRNPERAIASAARRAVSGLFAFPAQSNFSGVLHPLSLVDVAHAHGLDVLVDAAAFVPSHPFSLRACAADFTAVSFYKMFGYPTGVGALIARREALARLRRPWFAGGTVEFASVEADTHRLRAAPDAFEDGTPDFLNVAALQYGFDLLADAGMARVEAHVARLTAAFLAGLRALTHGNGTPLVRIYGPTTAAGRGGTVAFNVCDRGGAPIPYSIVEERAVAARVSVRGGCFCNPGASATAFGFDGARTATCLASIGDAFTVERFAECIGTTVGAVRASFGLATNRADVDRALSFIATFRS